MRRIVSIALCVIAVAGTASAERAASLRDGIPITTAAAERPAVWAADVEGAVSTPISPTKAVLYSLLLPGLGDYKLGNKGRATAFFAAEGLIWISYAVFEVQGGQREDEYQDLAARFAGVSGTGHADDFYARLREYDNSDEYEADVKLDGRNELAAPDCDTCPLRLDRISAEALDRYFIEHQVDDYQPWQWSSHDRRLQYSEVRSSSKTSYRRADYMFAAAAANRVVSAIVAYSAARHAHKVSEVGYRLDFAPAARGVDVSLTFTRSF